MANWSPGDYLRFAGERARPAADLLTQVRLGDPKLVYDLGCGPGNSTAMLAAAFPDAEIIGIDNSEAMLTAAKRVLPNRAFELADLADWSPPRAPDLLFANAAFQWVPGHLAVLGRLVKSLKPGGVLGVQMPDNLDEPSHRLMREVAEQGPWARKLAGVARQPLETVELYYSTLESRSCKVDIWRTIYTHPLADVDAIVEMLSSTGLRPYLDPLTSTERALFLADYTTRLGSAYPRQPDDAVLLHFPRLFIVAEKR
jgi:trans-aconitate 2-methyltransferase